jgi:signal transduction histidine kinase
MKKQWRVSTVGAALIATAAVLAIMASLSAGLRQETGQDPSRLSGGPVELGSDDKPETVLDHLRVYIEGVKGVYHSLYQLEPDRRMFSALPTDRPGGLGAALRAPPFPGSGVWLAFVLHNSTNEEFWAIVADGAGFVPSFMVTVNEDGTQSWYAGDALRRLRHEAGGADIVAYWLQVPANEKLAVYLRLDGGARFGPNLSVWPRNALLRRGEAIASGSGSVAGAAVIACFVYAVVIAGRARIRKGAAGYPIWSDALRLLYTVSAAAAVAVGFKGGGLSALLAGVGAGRYFLALSLGTAAMIFEGAAAFLRNDMPARYAGTAVRLLYLAGILVPALSTTSPYMSYVLPIGLTIHVVSMASIELASLIKESKTRLAEIERMSAWISAETRGGHDLMTATAAALRGPLHGFMSILEDMDAIVDELPSFPKQAADDLDLARAEAARLEVLIANILSYSGVRPPQILLEDLDAASIARSAAGLLRVAIAGRGIHIDVDVPILEIRNDIGILHRLIYIALGRASRTVGVRTIRVTATFDDDEVVLSIENDGAGHLPVSADADAPPDLDLIVMSRLAGLIGGSARYRELGMMNVHSLAIPRRFETAGVDPAERTGNDARWIAGDDFAGFEEDLLAKAVSNAGTVLIAGNEPVSLLAMKRRLESSSWSVSVTVSAREALSRVAGGERCDIVIIESKMPEMSGFDFCEAVRANKATEDLPIIVLVEAGRPDEIERAFKSGASDYIVSPSSGIELAARVKTHVNLAASVRREFEQAARMADLDKYRTLAMLSAGVAHEINTPNNAVLRNVPMLKEIWAALEVVVERMNREEGGFSVRGFGYTDLKQEIPDILNDLYMGAQDIKKIVEGLKDYARVPGDSVQFEPVDVNDPVRYAVRLLKHSVTLSTERFELSLDDSLPRVNADRLKLTQVVVNVLENALQALPDRSRGVRLETSLAEGTGGAQSVVIRVVDEGCGMDAGTLALLFDPFFTTKRDKGGSGLGLAVASGIVHDIGGSIELLSEPGEGTEAIITIPAAGNAGRSVDGRQ